MYFEEEGPPFSPLKWWWAFYIILENAIQKYEYNTTSIVLLFGLLSVSYSEMLKLLSQLWDDIISNDMRSYIKTSE